LGDEVITVAVCEEDVELRLLALLVLLALLA
jgi:hypothetical protein